MSYYIDIEIQISKYIIQERASTIVDYNTYYQKRTGEGGGIWPVGNQRYQPNQGLRIYGGDLGDFHPLMVTLFCFHHKTKKLYNYTPL